MKIYLISSCDPKSQNDYFTSGTVSREGYNLKEVKSVFHKKKRKTRLKPKFFFYMVTSILFIFFKWDPNPQIRNPSCVLKIQTLGMEFIFTTG